MVSVTAKLLFLYLFYVLQCSLDGITIAKALANGRFASGTHFQLHCIVIVCFYPLIKSFYLKHMATVLKFNVSSIFTFSTKENLENFLSVALKAQMWAHFPTETNAAMATGQQLPAGLVAGWAVASLATPGRAL